MRPEPIPSLYRNGLKLGILGGGQLGRMLLQAAIDLNLEVHVLDPDPQAPCSPLAHLFTVGSLLDYDTVLAFGRTVEVVTVEIENVNIEALETLAAEGVPVYPPPAVLRTIVDKSVQKQFYQQNGLPTAPFRLTQNRAELAEHLDFLPAFHKLNRGGYDGRGVQQLSGPADVAKAFDAPAVLEKAVEEAIEVAVIVARSFTGDVAAFPAVEMVFHPVHNLVEYLLTPARLAPELLAQAEEIAVTLAVKLETVGLLAVEMFVTPAGEVLVNEAAPRPHNSGHHTLKANRTSQYEQHLRSILGLPLGDVSSTAPLAAMVNLLGADGYSGPAAFRNLDRVLDLEGVYPHLYGKAHTKPFRKMGHVTILADDLAALHQKIKLVQELVQVVT